MLDIAAPVGTRHFLDGFRFMGDTVSGPEHKRPTMEDATRSTDGLAVTARLTWPVDTYVERAAAFPSPFSTTSM